MKTTAYLKLGLEIRNRKGKREEDYPKPTEESYKKGKLDALTLRSSEELLSIREGGEEEEASARQGWKRECLSGRGCCSYSCVISNTPTRERDHRLKETQPNVMELHRTFLKPP